jgi:putative peptidoglycan lipid II flippase
LAGLKVVGLCTLLSRVLGLVRDVGMAVLFGNGAIMDAFTVAFRIPNLARRFFGEGALTAAFLPVFVGEIEKHGKPSAWKLGSAVLMLLGVTLTALVLVSELLLWGIAVWGNVTGEGKLLIELTAIMLPYLILICLSSQISAMQHALGHFTWPALVPVVLNVVWIAGIWWIAPLYETPEEQVTIVSVCILVAGFFQMVAPWPTLVRLGFRYDPQWREAKTKVKEIIAAMVPVLLGLSVTQINTLVDSLIAWGFSAPESATPAEAAKYLLPSGTASALYLGQRMYQFPLGVFGVALGTVMFPLFSRHAQRGDFADLRRDFLLGLQLVMAIGIPASVGLVILADPLTDVLFRHGAFNEEDAIQTSQMIRGYGYGVWAYSALLIVQRGYYAVGDRATPLRVGLLAMICNLALSFALLWPLGGQGLAYATAISAIFQVVLTTWGFQWQVGKLEWGRLNKTILQSSLASLLMTGACWGSMRLLEEWQMTSRLLKVAVPVSVSMLAYFASAWLLKMKELGVLLHRGKR